MGDAETYFAQLNSMLGKNFFWRAHEGNFAFMHDQHAVCEKGDVVHVVRNHHYRKVALLVELLDEVEEIGARCRVKAGNRFIEDQGGGTHGKHAGKCHATLLAA